MILSLNVLLKVFVNSFLLLLFFLSFYKEIMTFIHSFKQIEPITSLSTRDTTWAGYVSIQTIYVNKQRASLAKAWTT